MRRFFSRNFFLCRFGSQRSNVSDFYGGLFAKTGEEKLQQNCCSNIDPEYVDLVSELHPDILEVDFGCGSPIAPLLESCSVLDLGSGSGKDCFIVSKLVGESGNVIGVDMTKEALDLSRSFLDYHRDLYGYENSNVEFIEGDIEDLKGSCGVEDNSIDVVISNCVINLTSDKEKVFREVYRILKTGGEMYFSDIFCSLRVPEFLYDDSQLWGECIAGALYLEDFNHLIKRVGFPDFRIVEAREIDVEIDSFHEKVEAAGGDGKMAAYPRFYSLTTRMIKIDNPEVGEEDYGQTVKYQGPGDSFEYDKSTHFLKGMSHPVSGNTAAMIESSRYPFEVSNKGFHRGPFLGGLDHWEVLELLDGCDKSQGCC